MLAVEPPRQDFAERLSHWLTAVDTVTLHGALQSIKTVAPEAPIDAGQGVAKALEAEFQRVRAALVDAIVPSAATRAVEQRFKSALTPEAGQEAEATYGPYHKRYQDQQRQMELKIAPLRAQVRQVLSRTSPRLRQLATLDAVMDQTLGVREQRLLSSVPVFLERRFEHLRKAQTQDDPLLWRQPGGWLHTFNREVQEALLAELEVRLQPAQGLIEAFSNEVKKHP